MRRFSEDEIYNKQEVVDVIPRIQSARDKGLTVLLMYISLDLCQHIDVNKQQSQYLFIKR